MNIQKIQNIRNNHAKNITHTSQGAQGVVK